MATDTLTKRPPTRIESEKASEAACAIARALTHQTLSLRIREDEGEVCVDLPPSLGFLLLDLFAHVARGQMVTFVPYGAELTTQEAADVLNVSRPFLIKLLEQEKIPFHKVGSHRRISMTDVLKYKEQRDKSRSNALDKLQRLGEEFDAA